MGGGLLGRGGAPQLVRALFAASRLRRWLGAALGGGHCPLHEDRARGGCGEERCLEPSPHRVPGGRGGVSGQPGGGWGPRAQT